MGQSAPIGTINSDFLPLIEKVSAIVHKISGNRLGDKQAYMVETRIKKRMMELGLKSAQDYVRYIDQNLDAESNVLVGLITTHHTFFFREFPHFEILKKSLPELVNRVKKRGDKTIRLWSAACSRGHEAYSLAMFLDFHLKEIDPTVDFRILGTDIDSESVTIAQNGVYHQNEIKEIPMSYLGKHWAHGTGEISMYAKVKSSLKSKCEFRPGNLLKLKEVAKNERFDVIFCRNVFIYFEFEQIELITKDLLSYLQPHGIFFSGISEPLSGLKVELKSIGPSAYMFKVDEPALPGKVAVKAPSVVAAMPVAEVFQPQILKVLCVDDSPSILTLLKKILSKEHGFEVVATAINGKDAMEKLKMQKVDLVTLDIHMPEMDGVTYLEKNYNKNHPPVIIISSASRDDSATAMKAFKYGASDYVEKPALNNMEERGEEIRTKLKSISQMSKRVVSVSSFDKENQKTFTISSPEKKLRVICGTFSDFGVMKNFFSELDRQQPPTVIFFEGQGELLEGMIKENAKDFKWPTVYYIGTEAKLEAGKIYFADFKKWFSILCKKNLEIPTSILIYGSMSAHAGNEVSKWKGAQILLEDLGSDGNKKHPLKGVSTDVVPVTSFSYMSCRYLSNK